MARSWPRWATTSASSGSGPCTSPTAKPDSQSGGSAMSSSSWASRPAAWAGWEIQWGRFRLPPTRRCACGAWPPPRSCPAGAGTPRRGGGRLSAGGLCVPGQRLAARDSVLDDRLGIIPPDHAARRPLSLQRHGPWFGQVVIGHLAQLRDVPADIGAVGVKAGLLAGGVVDAPKRWLRIDPDRGNPLPVAVVARLVTVDEQAHE